MLLIMNHPNAPAIEEARTASIIRESPSPDASFTPVLTLVLWLGCFGVGLFGFVLPYTRPHPPNPAAVVTAQFLNVELSRDLSPPDVEPSTAHAATPPDAMLQPDIPPPVAVAQPSAAIAFALPVEGPARIVDARNAGHARSAPAPVAGLAPTRLTFGRGEGKQPAPEYPLRARREGQEGTVIVRFTLNEAGRVLSAEAVQPSPWPLLNESAVNTIRERWHFSPGNVRAYEVSIRFELTK